MNSYTLAIGKILGVPFIHYLMAAVGMPVTMLCVICGGVSFTGWVASYLLLLVSGLFFCSASTLASAVRKAKTAQRTSPIALLVVLLWFGPTLGFAIFRGLGGVMGSGGGWWTCLLPFHSLWAVGQDTLDSYRVAFFGMQVNGVVGTGLEHVLMAWAGTARRLASDSQSLDQNAVAGGFAVLFLLLEVAVERGACFSNPWVPISICTLAAHVVRQSRPRELARTGSFRLDCAARPERPWQIPWLRNEAWHFRS